MKINFPDAFIWGTATAAYQVEGNNTTSDYWVMDHIKDGFFTEPAGDACDHYHRYEEDLDILAENGFKAYRFSIEWARVEPLEGHFSRTAINHYKNICEACLNRGIEPIVTLHHFSSPTWIAMKGGWENKETSEYFSRFVKKILPAVAETVKYICTFNEPNIVYSLKYLGILPAPDVLGSEPWLQTFKQVLGHTPGKFSVFPICNPELARETMISAHNQAYDIIKKAAPDIKVGLTLALQDLQAVDGGEETRNRIRKDCQDFYLEAAGKGDFIGVQTYTRNRYDADGLVPPEGKVTQMGYENYPQALEAAIRYAAERTGLPVLVTENGIATSDDNDRIEYIKEALKGVDSCLKDGIDVLGYIYWSLLDNYEWNHGYRPTFGLVEVDRENMRRKVKDSAVFLGKISKANALETE